MLAHMRNRQLIATYAVGFGVLFNFITTFTYVSFYLAAPPFSLSASWLGAIFVVYLTGSLLTPWTGWAVARFGRRRFTVRIIAVLGDRNCLNTRPFTAPYHRRTGDLRRLRADLSGNFDRLCHGHGQGRPLIGGRALCDVVLCRRQFRCSVGRSRLEFRRLAGLRRARCRHAGDYVTIVIFAWTRRAPVSTDVPPIESP